MSDPNRGLNMIVAIGVFSYIGSLLFGAARRVAPEERRERERLAGTYEYHQALLAREGFAPGYGIQPSGALGVEGTAEYWAEMEAGSIEAAQAAAARGGRRVPPPPDLAQPDAVPYVRPYSAITDPTRPRLERIAAMDVRIPSHVVETWTPAERAGGITFAPGPLPEDH